MNPTTSCPDPARLKQLLDGTLPDNEEAALTSHLETCASCQHSLEGLVAGKESWSGAAEQLCRNEQAPEAGLERVMEEIKSEGRDGQPEAEAPPGDDMSLDFFSPAENPEHLGRLGHYDVLEVIGRGGMGVVLKAFDSALHRVVAIKVLAPQLATSSAARKRFEREARAAAAVSHEHIVAIYAVEETKGLPYLVMEYIAGVSLQERLDRTGPLGPKEILRIGMQTARGLAAAHAQGLVHRDIKPANILLHNGVERVKITDFGLARAIDDASTTRSGYVAGTPQYMAPEQARGETVDHRADLFSLGSVLYALCTGRPPFRASTTMAVLKRVSEENARPLREVSPDLPAWLIEIIEKLHAKHPADRFQSAQAVAELLGEHLARLQQPLGQSVESEAGSAERIAPRAPRSALHASRLTRVAVLFLPLIAGGLVLTEATGLTQIKEWAATVLRVSTSEGTLVVEVDDPQVQVTIDGEELALQGAGPQEIRLKPGQHRIQAMKDGKPVPVDKDLVTITRGGKQIVRIRREVAIESLKGPKEQTQFEAIRLNQLDAKTVFDNLTNLFDVKYGPAPTFDFDKPKNTILIRGTTEQIETVKNILKQLGENASSAGGMNSANPLPSSSKTGGEHAKAPAGAVRQEGSPNLSTTYKIEPFHVLKINVQDVDPNHPIYGNYLVEPDGKIDLGPTYRKIKVSGLTLEEAEDTVRNYLKGRGFSNPMVSLSLVGWVPKWLGNPEMKAPYRIRPLQLLNVRALDVDPNHPLGGEYLIEPSGKINFGPAYGRVPLAGLTLEEAQDAIEKHLKKLGFANPIVSVTLAGWQKDWHDLMKQDPAPSQASDTEAKANLQPVLKEQLATMKRIAEEKEQLFQHGRITQWQLYQAKLPALQAELELAESRKERIAILEKIVALSRKTEQALEQLFQAGRVTGTELLEVKEKLLQAEIALERAKPNAAKPAEPAVPEAKVQHPKEIEAVPYQQYTGRLVAPQGDPIGLAFEMDERSFLRFQRLRKEQKIKESGSPLYVGLADENGFPHQGKLMSINDRVNPATGTVRVEGTMPNPGKILLPGMFVRIRMPFGPPRKVPAVPEEAILNEEGKHYVLVVNDKDVVERRDVTLGPDEGKMRIIEKGISPTDRVVVSGLGKLMPGSRVKPPVVGD